MHPIHDVDALLLLATALSAKRRPAPLVEIMAAVDLLQGNIPAAAKLAEAFCRLATHGLIRAQEGGFALTPAAQGLVAEQPKKALVAERLFGIKEQLGDYVPAGESPAIVLAAEQLSAAIEEHRAFAAGGGKNLLVPKPKPAENAKRPGQRQRKPVPARKRRD